MPGSDPLSPLRRSPRLLAAAGVVAVAIVVVVVVLLVSSGSGSNDAALPALAHRDGPETIFTGGTALEADPGNIIGQMHELGVNRVRVSLTWSQIAPKATSPTPPRGFDATNPAAYPRKGWAPFDRIMRDIVAHHLEVDMVLAPPPPRWAEGRGAPQPAEHPYWDPNAREFEQFVQAAGTRYSGHYTPPGQSKPLPRVAFWSLWNEPNNGVQLAPQTLNGPKLEVSPLHYRALAGAAWTALHKTGHGHDTTLIGELAPEGSTVAGAPGNFAVMAPLRFLRALYCVGSDYKPLRGTTATARGCPATAAGTARFAAENPALFHATAYADHPYPYGLPPNVKTPNEPDYAELAGVPKLLHVLDTLQHVYGSHKRFDVYSTEFGYQTSPPGTQSGLVSPTKAARWLNWSEYITWRQPRLVSYNQYLLEDPPPIAKKPYTRFASGLDTYAGVPKPAFDAFRMPIWMPVTSTGHGGRLEVWGCARPAKTVAMSRRAPVQIQWRPRSGGAFRTVARVPVRTRFGYFDVIERVPGSGSVRLRWSYPHGPVIFSRTVAVTVH